MEHEMGVEQITLLINYPALCCCWWSYYSSSIWSGANGSYYCIWHETEHHTSYKMAAHIQGNFRGRCATKFHKELSNAKLSQRSKISVQRLHRAIEIWNLVMLNISTNSQLVKTNLKYGETLRVAFPSEKTEYWNWCPYVFVLSVFHRLKFTLFWVRLFLITFRWFTVS